MKKTLLLAALVAFGWAAPAFAGAPPRAGDSAPAMSLAKVGGGNLTLASLKHKPVYLNFFASWCSPCNDEAPSVAALQRKYKTKGLVVVGVDEQEDISKGKGFAEKYKLPYAVVSDPDGATGRDYGVLALPVHVFIDRSGKISTYRLGEMSPAEIEAAIKKTL